MSDREVRVYSCRPTRGPRAGKKVTVQVSVPTTYLYDRFLRLVFAAAANLDGRSSAENKTWLARVVKVEDAPDGAQP